MDMRFQPTFERGIANLAATGYALAAMERRPGTRRASEPLRTKFNYKPDQSELPFDREAERELREKLDAVEAAQQRAEAASRDTYIS